MRFTETVRVTKIACERCDTRVDESTGDLKGWIVAQMAFVTAQTATVEYHLCPDCRTALGDWVGGEPAPSGKPGPIPPWPIVQPPTPGDADYCSACAGGVHSALPGHVCRCCGVTVAERGRA